MSKSKSQGVNDSKAYITAMRDNTKAIRSNSNAVRNAMNELNKKLIIADNSKKVKSSASSDKKSADKKPDDKANSVKDLKSLIEYAKSLKVMDKCLSAIKDNIKSYKENASSTDKDDSSDEKNESDGESKETSDKPSSNSKSIKSKVSGALNSALGVAKNYAISFAIEGLESAKELENIQKNVSRIFSDTSMVDNWSKNLVNKFGLNQIEAKNFANTIGDVAKSSGITGKDLNSMSLSLVELGADMASAFNMSPEDMIGNLSDALSGGDSMESFGISFSGDEFKDYLKSSGFGGDLEKISNQDMVELRYKYIMENTTDYKSAFQKNSKNLNAQMQILEDNMTSIKLDVMKEALPIIEMVMSKINDLASKIRDWVLGNLPLIQSFRNSVAGFLTALFPIIDGVISIIGKIAEVVVSNWSSIEPILTAVISAMAAYYAITSLVEGITMAFAIASFIKDAVIASGAGVVNAATIAQWALNTALNANPIGLVIAAIAIFIGILVLAYKKIDWVKDIFDSLWGVLMTVLGAIGKVAKGMMKLFGLGDGESTFEVNEEKTTTTKDQSLGVPTRSDIDAASKDSYLQSMESLKPSTAGMADYSANDYSDGLGQNFGVNEFNNPSKINYQSNSGIGTDPLNMKSNQTNVNVTIEGNIYGEKDLVDRVGKAIADRVSTMIPVVV